jgi:hypothetical protein
MSEAPGVRKWYSSLQQALISLLPGLQSGALDQGGTKLLYGSMARLMVTDNGRSA